MNPLPSSDVSFPLNALTTKRPPLQVRHKQAICCISLVTETQNHTGLLACSSHFGNTHLKNAPTFQKSSRLANSPNH
jgi:hypothetical protein